MKGSFFRGIVSALLWSVFLVILVNKALSQTAQPNLHIRARSAVLMDAISGQVLFDQDPQLRMAPASFVKLLTLYVTFDALRDGHLKKDDLVEVSQKACCDTLRKRTQESRKLLEYGFKNFSTVEPVKKSDHFGP